MCYTRTMVYKYKDGDRKQYFNDEEARSHTSTMKCPCGCQDFQINYIPPPCNTGGFIKLTCVDCDKVEILMDDYA